MSKYRLGDLTIKNWNSWDSVPRMPEAAALYVTGASSFSAALQVSAATAAAYAAVYVGTTIAISAVTSWAIGALSPKPDFGAFSSAGLQANVREPSSPQQYIYGQMRKGGTIVDMASSGTSNKFLHMIIALAGHEVAEVGDIYINDEVVTITDGLVTSSPWNSKIVIEKYTGATPYVLGDRLNAFMLDQGRTNLVGYGIAFLYVRLEYDQDVFANGIPNFTAVVKGKKVYDPRDSGQDADNASTWTYSNNPALCIADYIRADYGLGDGSYSRIDDTMLQVAANICDEDITLPDATTENRYECNGVLSAQNTPASNIEALLTSCGGTLYWGSGKWKIRVGAYTTPVKDFTLDDLRSGINVKTRTSARDNFNGVQGTFIDASQDWITADYPAYASSLTEAAYLFRRGYGVQEILGFLSQDGGVENILDLNLPFTTSSTMAQRIAKMTLFKSRQQITVSAEFGMSAFELEVGDVIRLTIDRYGWSNKEFEVISWALVPNADAGDMRVAMTLQETSSVVYASNVDEVVYGTVTQNLNLPKYNDIPTFGITPSLESASYSEKLQRDLVLDITSSAIDRIEQIEIQIARANDANGILDATGIINREQVIQELANGAALFSDNLIGSRKLGDFDNDGDVDVDDLDIYVNYYFGTNGTQAQLDRINEMHQFFLNNQVEYSRFIYSNFLVKQEYETLWVGAPPKARLKDFAVGRWDIRARAITKLGLRSDWVTHPKFEVPYSDPDISPATLGFASPNDIQSVGLFWKESSSQSLSHYEVRHSDLVEGEEITTGNFIAGHHYEITNVGDTDFTAIGAASNTVGVQFWCHSPNTSGTPAWDALGDGTTGKAKNVVYIDKTVNWVDRIARPANFATCGIKTGTYVIRAYSKAGTPSLDYLKIPVTSAEFTNPFTSSSTMNVWDTAGQYAEIELYSTESYYPSGDYALVDQDAFKSTIVFDGNSTVDIGSVTKARVSFEFLFIRLNIDFKLNQQIDGVFGMWDNLGMLVDDITNEYQDDFDIIPYVKISDDGTNYSSWQRVTSNIVSGRYFQFKVEINSSYNAGPVFRDVSVTRPTGSTSRITTNGLIAKVEY